MSTPASDPGTPALSHYLLNQLHLDLPVSSHVAGSVLPQLVSRPQSSRSTLPELSGSVEKVNRLWTLFENALNDLRSSRSHPQGIHPFDNDGDITEADEQEPDISKVAYQAQHYGLRALKNLSYSERGLALIVALREGYVDVIHALLNKESDLYAADERGVTALRVAAETGQLKILAYLLKAGCSVEAEPSAQDQRDAIQDAEQHGQIHAAVMMGLYTNIRLSMIEADHPYRHYRGESPVAVMRHRCPNA